jgi:SAM-dependent methyltransferase
MSLRSFSGSCVLEWSVEVPFFLMGPGGCLVLCTEWRPNDRAVEGKRRRALNTPPLALPLIPAGIAEIAFRRLYPPGLPASQRPMADVSAADAMALPYRRRCCDGVLCIAVLHHISTAERRLRLLREIIDILVPGGRALVTVWATEQENMDKVAKWEPIAVPVDSGEGVFAEGTGTGTPHAATAYNNAAAVGGQDYLVPWHLPLHRAEAAAAAGATATSNVDAAKNALVFRRFYHLFAPGELESLVERVPGAEVVDSFYDKDNWCVVFRRKECE